VVGDVAAGVLERVGEAVREQVDAHEEEDDARGEAGEDLAALEAKGAGDGAAAPDLEVAGDVDGDAEEGAERVEEEQVRERRRREAAVRARLHVGGHAEVAEAPEPAGRLGARHAGAELGQCGDGEGDGQGERRLGGGLEDDLVGDAAARVLVAAAAAEVLGGSVWFFDRGKTYGLGR
jgi:hypothetical protein